MLEGVILILVPAALAASTYMCSVGGFTGPGVPVLLLFHMVHKVSRWFGQEAEANAEVGTDVGPLAEELVAAKEEAEEEAGRKSSPCGAAGGASEEDEEDEEDKEAGETSSDAESSTSSFSQVQHFTAGFLAGEAGKRGARRRRRGGDPRSGRGAGWGEPQNSDSEEEEDDEDEKPPPLSPPPSPPSSPSRAVRGIRGIAVGCVGLLLLFCFMLAVLAGLSKVQGQMGVYPESISWKTVDRNTDDHTLDRTVITSTEEEEGGLLIDHVKIIQLYLARATERSGSRGGGKGVNEMDEGVGDEGGDLEDFGFPHYASCKLRLHGLSILDYALLSEAAYFPIAQVPDLIRAMFNASDAEGVEGVGGATPSLFEVLTPPEVLVGGNRAQFFEAYSRRYNLSVIAIRGTDIGRISDFVEGENKTRESKSPEHTLTRTYTHTHNLSFMC